MRASYQERIDAPEHKPWAPTKPTIALIPIEVSLWVDSCRPIPRGERLVSLTFLTFNQPHSTAPSWPVSNSGGPVTGCLRLCISARATSQ